MPATTARRLVSLADAADALAVSRRYIADGQLEAVRLGRIRGRGADTSQLGRHRGR